MKTALKHLAPGLCCIVLASCAGVINSAKKKPDAEQTAETTPSGSRFLQDNSGQADAGGNRTATNPQTPPAPETPPVPEAPAPNKPQDTANTTPPATTPPPPTPPPATGAPQYPYGKPVPGKKGFVYSPYDEKAGMIDVKDYAPGTKVRDPYTNKIFLVP